MYRSHTLAIISAFLLGGCFDITEPDLFLCSETFSQCPGDKECINGKCQLRDAGKGGDLMKVPDQGPGRQAGGRQ